MADRNRLDTPANRHRRFLPKINLESEELGRIAEKLARFSGTPQFILFLTIIVVFWLSWNYMAPDRFQFDKSELGFTVLTLVLSLQASYSAPLILLAQNRQSDYDRVQAEQDRQTAARNLDDTEYLTREIAGLRVALENVATRDFVRTELRDLIEELKDKAETAGQTSAADTEPNIEPDTEPDTGVANTRAADGSSTKDGTSSVPSVTGGPPTSDSFTMTGEQGSAHTGELPITDSDS